MLSVKAAATDLAASIVTEQVPVPTQPLPLQPVKVEPLLETAVRITLVLLMKDAKQVEPQSMPVGLLVTVPLPVPSWLTVRV